MKTSVKLFALGLILAGFGINANAQNTVSNNATAVVKKALTITKGNDLSFGTFSGLSDATSTVIMSNAGVRTGTADMIGSDGNAGTFGVTGEASQIIAITLPASDVTLTSGANTMTIASASFNSDKTVAGVALNGTGNLTISVGATLSVGNNQAAGSYSGTFSVSVNYN